MNDIIPISDADKLGFVSGIHAVSAWGHSVNRHNGFWEDLEALKAVASTAGPSMEAVALREIVLGRIALIHSEGSEGVEAVRKHPVGTWTSTEKDSMVSEMAGTVVRIMDLCQWLGLPLGEAVIAEVNRNEKRGWKHGNKAT
jgi:hypothetical protein